MKKTERAQALTVLLTVLQHQTPLSHALQTAKDITPFCKELCFGVCRYFIRLEALAGCLVNKRPKPKDFDVWLSILMGLYQLHVLNLPDYAVVKETVAVLDGLKKSWAKGLVNATLRTYCREKAALTQQLSQNEAYTHNHPAWLLKKIKQDWPQDWKNILQANDTHPPMNLRINARHLSREQYLANNPIGMPHLHANQCITLNTPMNVQDVPGFPQGDVSVQDSAAQLAAQLLDLKPGLRVLDACCAPGGKTGHILETEPALATLIALDVDEKRLKRVQENLDRLKIHATLIQGDGLTPDAWWDGKLFDRILLDAPCSATGVIRRHPDIRLLRSMDDILKITEIQHALIRTLWPLLTPGGLLVYATCSIMPEENEQQIAHFIQDEPSAKILNIQASFGTLTPHGRQILPGDAGMDGFFYSVLQKCK